MQRILIITASIILLACSAFSAVPTLMNYQGYLTTNVGDPVADGSYSVIFTVYDAPTAGTPVWTENQNVTTTNGQFVVLLGTNNPLIDSVFIGATRYLGIAVSGDPELSPRMVMVSVPYSHRVNTVDGAEAGFIIGNLVIGNEQGDTLIYAGIDLDGGGALSIFADNPSTQKNNFASAEQKMKITADGVFFFGATTDDTTMQIFNNGDIVSIGQIAFGENTASSGDFSTSFGSDNLASGDSSTVSGGSNNVASGVLSTVSGGKSDTASGNFSTVGGGLRNIARNIASTVGGGEDNTADTNYATVAGGYLNVASGLWSTVSGGEGNDATFTHTTIGGGSHNSATSFGSTVSGGTSNNAGFYGFVGGGRYNDASGSVNTISGGTYNTCVNSLGTIGGGDSNTVAYRCVVGGGVNNSATGNNAVIPGGRDNVASGVFSFAAGRRAKANHDGSFVWGDSFNGDVTSSAINQFTARTSGGARFYSNTALNAGVTLASGGGSWASVSDSTLKRNIREVDYQDVLHRVSELPISQWSYKSQDESIEHIGPMAQDFYRLFGLDEDDKHISTIDPAGISLAAIKGLNQKLEQKLEQKDMEISVLQSQIDELKELIHQLAKSSNNTESVYGKK